MPLGALWLLAIVFLASDLRAAVHSNLVYARADGKDLLLDLYVPESATNGRFPVVVWIHGGAWRSGSKEKPPAARLTARGYAVASISYRFSAEALFPAQIHDAKAAVRWLRANAAEYGLDPARFAAWGASAGGHLAALLGTSGGVAALEGTLGNQNRSSRVQAVIDFFGPTDFLKMDAAGSKMHHDAPDSPESKLIGGPIQQNAEKAARANPITYVSADDPPFLIMHGDRDPLVPHDQSRLLHEALKKAGVEATFETVEGAGHGFSGPEIDRAVDAFLDRRLKAPAPVSAAWADPDKSEPAGTKYRTFHSKTVKTDVSYLIYLPPGYETDRNRRYPVIYWLHGLGEDQRSGAPFVTLLDRAIRAGQTPPRSPCSSTVCATAAIPTPGMENGRSIPSSFRTSFRTSTLRGAR
jgi:acetyl esterase/lipase